MVSRLRSWLPAVVASSSLALLVLLPVEILSWVLIGDPTERDTQWVADRWANSAWRAIDWVFLVVALVHGALGLAHWLTRGPGRRGVGQAIVGAVLAVCAALIVLATYTLFTFEIAP
jgi:succinate dehydrogenase hydrophobic anchor subunit